MLVQSGPFSQRDVDRYQWCFRAIELGKWISQGSVGKTVRVVTADAGMPVPRIVVGPGLAQTTEVHQQPLSFVLAIQGVSGLDKLKVVLEDSIDKAAATMLHEALNGYSTVFSAAFSPSFTAPLFTPAIEPLNANYEKVVSFTERSRDGSLLLRLDSSGRLTDLLLLLLVSQLVPLLAALDFGVTI